MADRSTNTMSESLQRLLADLSQMKTLPDADLDFVINLETQIVAKLREPIDRLAEAGLTNAPPNMAGMGGGGIVGGTPTYPGPPGGGVPGMRTGAGMPNADEMRRLIGAGGVQGGGQ